MGTIHATDPASITKYGTYAASVTTSIAGKYDATTRALMILDRQSVPAWVLSGVSIQLELIGKLFNIDPTEDVVRTSEVLALEVHDLISITDMPAGGPYDATVLWVEGWTETISYSSWRIDFAVSEYCRHAASPTWDEQAPAVSWDTAPDISWDEMTCTPPTLSALEE